jgi:hypothetical protein
MNRMAGSNRFWHGTLTGRTIREATRQQVALFCARRADPENVFDELKNQGLPGRIVAAGPW